MLLCWFIFFFLLDGISGIKFGVGNLMIFIINNYIMDLLWCYNIVNMVIIVVNVDMCDLNVFGEFLFVIFVVSVVLCMVIVVVVGVVLICVIKISRKGN